MTPNRGMGPPMRHFLSNYFDLLLLLMLPPVTRWTTITLVAKAAYDRFSLFKQNTPYVTGIFSLTLFCGFVYNFITTRCYADYAVTKCLSICLSVICQYRVKTAKHIIGLFHHWVAIWQDLPLVIVGGMLGFILLWTSCLIGSRVLIDYSELVLRPRGLVCDIQRYDDHRSSEI